MIYLFAPVLKLTVYAFGCQAELSSKLASFSLASQAPQVTEPLAASIVPAKTHCTAVASISGTTSGKSGVAYTPWRRPCIQVLSVPKCSEAGGCWIVKEAGSDAPPPGGQWSEFMLPVFKWEKRIRCRGNFPLPVCFTCQSL